MVKPQAAILLLGPTSSGKTPLGELLARHALNGNRCAHFDFGEHLRRIATGRWSPQTLTPEDVYTVACSLRERTLLTDAQFHIAEGILRAFISERGSPQDELLVLNGMPRHVDQAARLHTIVQVKAVMELQCTADVVLARIQKNSGGDRTGRDDDALDAVRHKLEIYRTQTLPLLDYYRSANTPVYPIVVRADSSASDMFKQMNGTVINPTERA